MLMGLTMRLLPGTTIIEIEQRIPSWRKDKVNYFYKDLVMFTRPSSTLGTKEDSPVCDTPLTKADIEWTEKYYFPRLTENEQSIVLQARKRTTKGT